MSKKKGHDNNFLGITPERDQPHIKNKPDPKGLLAIGQTCPRVDGRRRGVESDAVTSLGSAASAVSTIAMPTRKWSFLVK